MRLAPTLTPRRLRQLWYAPLLTLAMGLMMLRMLVMARMLDVGGFASFSGGILVSSTFCMFGCLGLQSLVQREWPVHLVHRQELRAVVRAMQCHLVAGGLLVVGLLAAAFGFEPAGLTPTVLGVGLLHGFSQQVFLVSTVESRSRGDTVRFASQNMARSLAALLLSVAVASIVDSAVVVLCVDALATLAISVVYIRQAVARVRVGIASLLRLALRRLGLVPWRAAVTLMSVMMVSFALLNLDRWVASARLGSTGFGLYSFAWIVLSIAQSAQVVVSASVYPMVARRFAEQGGAVAFGVCLRVSVAILVLGAMAALPIALLLQYAVGRWFAQYTDALTLLPWFLAIAVLRVSDFWSSYLLVRGAESRLLGINIVTALCATCVWLLLARPWLAGPSTLEQVAWLAVLLTVLGYASTAALAFRLRA